MNKKKKAIKYKDELDKSGAFDKTYCYRDRAFHNFLPGRKLSPGLL
jgi:hypothetical protein